MPVLLSVEKIWSHAYHNAMPDIIYYRDRFLCCLRESTNHVGAGEGQIRILSSPDGVHWEAVALIILRGVDLRDPMLSEMPDGRLQLNMGGSIIKKKRYHGCYPCVAFSSDGHTWSDVAMLKMPDEWLWRVTWHKGVGYTVAYRQTDRYDRRKPWVITLFTTTDGLNYVPQGLFDVPDHPSEVTLRFTTQDMMVAMVRRQGYGCIGSSNPPYNRWSWFITKHYFGGPNFVILPNGQMWAGSRMYIPGKHHQARTILAYMTQQYYEPVLILPSGGDTSYPGMLFRDEILYMCYYSSHQGKSMIYLARIKL